MRAGKAAVLCLVELILATTAAAGQAATRRWLQLHREQGIVLEEADASGDVVLVRANATLPCSRDALAAVLLDLERFPQWVPRLAGWNVVERDAGAVVVYGRQHLPWPFRDRDYVIRYTWRSQADGVFVLESRSEEGSGPAPVAGIVRLRAAQEKWQLVPNEGGGTAVAYTFNGNLDGWMPHFWQRAVWKRDIVQLLQRLGERAGERKR